MSPRGSRLLTAAAALMLALSPIAADARLGGGGSMGSRGANTYAPPPSTRTAPNGAQQMDRTLTQRDMQGQSQGVGFRRPSMFSGFMMGLLGAGLFGLFFGGGGFGLVIKALLLFFVVRWVYRRFMVHANPGLAGGPNIFGRSMPGAMGGAGFGGAMPGTAGPQSAPVQISPADFQTFEQILQATQAAWTAGDLAALRGMTTPEMAGYFAEQLTDQHSRGVTNSVTSVALQSGDLAQAWAEGGRQYATVAMRFSMIDVTKDAAGRVVDGSATEHVTATEIWTFVRASGGQWILSAIQQAR